MATIEITFNKDGSTSVDAKGFSGSGCEKATEQIEIVLGGSGQKKKTTKPEYFAPASTQGVVNKLTF
jgi:hypothetical protein